MKQPSPIVLSRAGRSAAFSLAELMVATTVLAILVALVTQLFTSAESVTGLGNRHLDADEQARALFDRMAIDLGQMVKRADIDYFLKDTSQTEPGNDQIAFYSQVPGFYSASGPQSPYSLVGYRINSATASPFCNQLQRFGCGLLWSTGTSATPPQSLAFLPATIKSTWPAATDPAQEDKSHYELAGPQVFRFEYYYVLKGQSLGNTSLPSLLSNIPWDTRAGVAHSSVGKLQDVAALGVVIAVIDPKAQATVKPADLTHLAGLLEDFDSTKHAEPGALEAAWQNQVNASGLPRALTSSIRIYRRWFYLSPSPLPPL